MCLNVLPQNTAVGLIYSVISKPATQAIPARLCSTKGSGQTLLTQTQSPWCCSIPRVTIRKHPKPRRQHTKPQKLPRQTLSWKSLKLQVSPSQTPVPSQCLCWSWCSSSGAINTGLKHLPHLIPAQAMARGGAGCEMNPSQSSWAVHISQCIFPLTHLGFFLPFHDLLPKSLC